jgi:L-asparaginase
MTVVTDASVTPQNIQEKNTARAHERNIGKGRVAAVFTGGTIAVSPTKSRGVAPGLSGKEIMALVPETEHHLENIDIEIHDFATLPGPHVSPEMMLTLAQFVQALAERADGVVIAHGTDTLEECAFFLDMVLGDHKPIILTGSMHTATDAAWDGGRNLIDAIAVAGSKQFDGQGVMVVMDGLVHAASEVTKTHSMRTDTFKSLDFGPLGTVSTLASSAPMRSRAPRHRLSFVYNEDWELPYVELLKTYTGMDDGLFVAALKGGAAGFVVEAMGQGNVPPGVVNGIARAREMGLPVVVTTRCPSGPVRPYYTYEGAGKELEQLGCIFAPYLTGPKARLALMLAIASGYSLDRTRSLFLAG